MRTSDVKVMSLRRNGGCISGLFVPNGATADRHRVERRSPRRAVAASLTCLILTAVIASCSSDTGSDHATPASGSLSSCPDALDWSEASGVVGEDAELVGDVISASYRPDVSGEPTFLNIGVDYPDGDRLTVIIWGEDRAAFAQPPEAEFDGERVCIRGEVSSYKGVSEVEVSDPSQINVD